MLELCVPSGLGDTPKHTEDHDLNPFSKPNLHNKRCCSFVPQSPAFIYFFDQKQNQTVVCWRSRHDVRTREWYTHHLVKLWQGDALIFSQAATYDCVVFLMQQTMFFSVVLSMNVVTKGSQLKAAAVWLFVNVVWSPTYTHTPICFIVVVVSSRVSSSTYRLERLYCINCYALNISILLTMHGGGFLHVWKGKKKE